MKAPKPVILVVENHPDTLLGLELFLKGCGYQCRIARTMKSALKIAREKVFDVLLSDISLPDGDGWELMRRLGEERRVTGIAMSGYGADSDLAKSKAAGFIQHMTKPFLPEELKRALESALKVKSAVLARKKGM